MLSVLILGVAMIASASTGAIRQTIHAPARNMIAVATSWMTLPPHR